MPILIEKKWQIPMTQCAIDTLRYTTEYPFELVIVETCSNLFGNHCDKYIHRLEKTNATKDINLGIKEATGDYIVYTGNDVFTRPDWLSALMDCFNYDDCGASTTASADLHHSSVPIIQEGIYGPFMAFENKWFFDEENFPGPFANTDLILRIYKSGKRMYRNWGVVIQHLNRQTIGDDKHEQNVLDAKRRFIEKHQGCPLMMYKALTEGWII